MAGQEGSLGQLLPGHLWRGRLGRWRAGHLGAGQLSGYLTDRHPSQDGCQHALRDCKTASRTCHVLLLGSWCIGPLCLLALSGTAAKMLSQAGQISMLAQLKVERIRANDQ